MAELVAKTSSPVAVTQTVTVLLDWVNIESLTDFTLVIENAGGGSANDIADVQIDTSDDGGVTVSTDQHDGVPAVPIAAFTAKSGTFTETAKFVRVRAQCGEGEDTTATAILLADSSVGRICTLSDVKARLGETDTENDTVLTRIILGIEKLFAAYCKRELLANAADITEYYAGCGPHLALRRYPIIAVTSIKQALAYDFDSFDALTENTHYRLVNDGRDGIIYRMYTDWFNMPDSIQVVYRGGYCAAGQTPGEGETAMPADLREAAIEQATFLWKRKDDIGLSAVGFEGGSVSKFSAVELLPMVRQILDNYRRPQL